MNIALYTVLCLLGITAIHWFCDFVIQSRFEAENKSSSNMALFSHVIDYTTGFAVSLLFVGVILSFGDSFVAIRYVDKCFQFLFVIALLHFVTDYFTSRLNKFLWSSGRQHDFWIRIGADQLFHSIQLFLTWYFVFGKQLSL